MTGHDDFDRTLADWFRADALSPTPADELGRVLAATGRRTPRPAWLAGLGSNWVGDAFGTGSVSGVRVIPGLGLRWSTALIVLLVIAALVGGAIMVGARWFQPSPVPTGQLGHLAYGLGGDIYVADWDGRNPVRIADGLPVLDGPSPCGTIWGEGAMWSPDGRYLAYRSDHGGAACLGTVHISDADGHPVASFPGTGWQVTWSPDSTRLATWVEQGPRRAIGIYGLDGVRHALLTLPTGLGPPGDYDPKWSPDGRSILMRLAPPLPSVVWEFPIDGGTPQRVRDGDPRSSFDAAFSHDGSRAALVHFGDSDSLLIAEADGTEPRVLLQGARDTTTFAASGGAYHDHPVWSPSDDRIAFSWSFFDRDSANPDTPVQSAFELRVVEVSTGNVTTVAAGPEIQAITFSPEGDRILFRRTDVNSLWSVNADGSDTQRLVAGTSWGDWQWQAEP